jgi:hypothetical protein
MTPSSPKPRWSHDQIRTARIAPLVPLIKKRGLPLVQHDAGNYTVPAYPGLIVKDSYWRWPDRELSGNAIDPAEVGLAHPSSLLQ